MISKRSVALIGLPLCGKTTWGQWLAKKFEYAFIDTDWLIQQKHPTLTCREIFQLFGQSYFRSLERDVIDDLKPTKQVIIATGGGVIYNDQNRNALKKYCRLIYLKLSFSNWKERIFSQTELPAYISQEQSSDVSLKKLYASRTLIYENWADQTIDMNGSMNNDFSVHLLMSLQFVKEENNGI
ncbi:shikimate kinase [Candidatus Protochlamydia amoebophila]|uniref:Shikimate kinase n=1 Tax=Protochlamydia amoebophila (strain UWE25) TaxID=264201 RepID=A0A2P9H9Q0_PARUW|nr:shikimate kinase [Candidatus Protochlamydia amoebophila]SPJ31730.1 unnamed protein product [Candidatus Protochlamydia amoebophila UWE25]